MIYPKKNRIISGIVLIADSNTLNLYPTKLDGHMVEQRIESKYKFKDNDTFILNNNNSNTKFKRELNEVSK